MLVLLALGANAPALALVWGGEMAPLPQYQTYCQTYGARDPGCHVSLGGRAAALAGADSIGPESDTSLGMAVLIHRQVVADLIFTVDESDVWQVLGSGGTGRRGDCDDVVMTSINRLLRRGFPRAALRATIVRLPDGGGHHLILGIRTGRQEMFLDDRHRRPMSADMLASLGYQFVAQEEPGARFWRRALAQPALQVAGRPLSPTGS